MSISRLWQRYRAVLVSRDFIITATTGLFILLSGVLALAGVTPEIHTAFALAGVAVGGSVIIIGAVRALLQRRVNVDELVAIAIIASVIYGEYLSAAFVAFMMLFGKLLEDFTAERASSRELSPIEAAIFHNFGSVGVVVNSARLAGTKNLTQDYPFLPRLFSRKKNKR